MSFTLLLMVPDIKLQKAIEILNVNECLTDFSNTAPLLLMCFNFSSFFALHCILLCYAKVENVGIGWLKEQGEVLCVLCDC